MYSGEIGIIMITEVVVVSQMMVDRCIKHETHFHWREVGDRSFLLK